MTPGHPTNAEHTTMLLTTDTVWAYQLPGRPAGYTHLRVFTPTSHRQRPVIIIGELTDNPGPPIMTTTVELIALVRADFLPEDHRAPRVLAYHPDPQGTGWFTAITPRHGMPPRYLPRSHVITHAGAERATRRPLATYPAADYTRAHLQAPRRR